jgi:hypothetical protein
MKTTPRLPETPLTLITRDPNLVVLMLNEYPGILRETQIQRRTSLKPPQYTFSLLDRKSLNDLLKQHGIKAAAYRVAEINN